MTGTVDWEALADEVERRHGAHTVLLYGSHARGEATPASDVDVIAIRPGGGGARDLAPWRGHEMDVHLLGEDQVDSLARDRAPSLRDARVLRERGDMGERILADVRRRLGEPPPAMPPGERAALWAWGDKMRGRLAHPDPNVAAMHRATLLVEALPARAEVRGRWFFGAKAALRSMASEDPGMAAAYAAAAQPGAGLDAHLKLLETVFAGGTRPESSGSTSSPPLLPDADFLDAFERHAIPAAAWRHRDHLRAAYLLLERHPLDEAISCMRSGVRGLNARHGVPERIDSGYHETLTQMWMRIVQGVRTAAGPEAGFDAFLEHHPYLLDRRLGRLFYTRERMMTEQAKRAFAEPDITPLPGTRA